MTAATVPAPRDAARIDGRVDARAIVVRAAAVVAAWQALRLARALARDVAVHRQAAAVLRHAWTPIAIPESPHVLSMHAREGGDACTDAPPVVLVHGYGVSSRYFVPLAGQLARTAHVLAPDLPGHGRSQHATAPLAVPAMAGALAAWMRARDLRGAVLVGQSMGAQIATELAVREPALASGLVLLGPTVDPAARTAVQLMARAVPTALAERPLLDLSVAWDYVCAGPRLVAHEMRHMLHHRVETLLPLLPTLGIPTRVLRGEHDHIAPQPWTDAVAADAGAGTPEVVPDGAHAVQYSAPAAVAAAVLAVVAEARGAASAALESSNAASGDVFV